MKNTNKNNVSAYLDIKLEGLDQDGKEMACKLSDFKGQKVVLYFYPKDATPGCTQEACNFRDSFNRLKGKATVIGVSPDDIKSHKKFREHQELNFILLSDVKHKLADALCVWQEKSMYGKKMRGIVRSTFVLDENGKIEHEWRDVKVSGHVDEVLEHLKA